MRVLHIGSGFRPWRRGGLVAYTEDLMDEQLRSGHEVSYLFSGRQYPLARGPRLRRWDQRGVAMLEIVNSPLHDHGRQPELELSEPRVEAIVGRVLAELRPDAVHVHEVAGLPSSVIDAPRALGIPVVVTLQDYFLLCPTFKLLDAEGRVCLRRDVGAECVAATAADPRSPGLMFEATVKHDLHELRLVRRLDSARTERWIGRAARAAARLGTRSHRGSPPASAPAFQRRRDVNVERLGRADCVIAMSHRVAEIHEQLGVDPARIRTLQLTLSHIERLTPRQSGGARPVTFGTLAGLESEPKGGRLLLETIDLLGEDARAGRFRLLVFGHVDPQLAAAAALLPGVELRGAFRPEELDRMLDAVDVGIVPSVWEEAYAYAGIEFLAKGIPVIANAIGGMPDYTRDGETGWLNRSCSAEELARIMAGLVEHPERVAELSARVIAARGAIVKPMARHAAEMDAVYRELIGARVD